MKINLVKKLNVNDYDGIIIPIYEKDFKINGLNIDLKVLKEKKKFEGKIGTLYKVTLYENESYKEVVLLGLGKSEEFNYRKFINAIASGYKEIKKQKVKNIVITLNNSNIEISDEIIKGTTEAIILADYKFDKYKTFEDEDKENKNICIDIAVDNSKEFIDAFNEGIIIGDSNLIARDLVDQPANIMDSIKLAETVEKLGKENGFEVEIIGLDGIKDLKMEAYLSVAKASDIEPRFIIMRYIGDKNSDNILGYVGKGLTYDSGGLSIKPTKSMAQMKADMGGSAAVIGAMCGIAKSKIKRNVVSVVAACENMISGRSYRPGDIIDSMGGKTIYIGNTDAEGRLTLIDAMHYIVTKEKVTEVLDIATLTGAALHCSGGLGAVTISNNDEFYNRLESSFKLSGELITRLPIFDEYKELIKHSDADLTNTAGKPGTVTAGLFIGEFNGDLPWLHVDIAGAEISSKDNGVLSKCASGIGTKPLYYLAKNK